VKLNPYGRLCTQFYDLSKPESPQDAFNFYLKQAKMSSGSVLELMCGTGRFLIPLLEQGINIEGTDASPDMLQACREKCVRKGLKPVLYEQRIEEIDLPKKYRLIIIPASSFILITNLQVARKSLKKIHEHLITGGKLILDIDTPKAVNSLPGQWMGRWVERPDGATVVFSALSHYDRKEKIEYSIHKYELFKDGQLLNTELEHFATRYYEIDEFKALLEEAGFRNIKATKPFTDLPPDSDDQTILFSEEK
jgi:SAM-dependent methyltransferase